MRSLRNRLSVAFALIVAGAIAIVYFYVTPRLEDQLVEQKLGRLVGDARRATRGPTRVVGIRAADRQLIAVTNAAARYANAEVTLLEVREEPPGQFIAVATSGPTAPNSGDSEEVAARALTTQKAVAVAARTRSGRHALAAVPLIRSKRVRGVAVFAASLEDVQANVALIRQRILISGAIALVLAGFAGYLVARYLTARIMRLEQAARKVAAGDFSNPIRADSDDELGRVADAFDDMQSQLARLDTARKQFIASASHELRTPIFSLGGFLELLEDEDLDEETRLQFLAQLRGQLARLRRLATELLDLSRLESGPVELDPQPTDIGALARLIASEFMPAASSHDTRLVVLTEPDPVTANCDRERVAQIIRILLDNALVHTPAGTSVTVSTRSTGERVDLEVADSGAGIRVHTLPHIFEPFFTSDGTRGAGLGLAIARELADQMQGELTVRSIPGETAFRLSLPVDLLS